MLLNLLSQISWQFHNLITPTGETQRPPTHYPNYQPAFNPSYISGDSYKIEVATLQLY